MTSVKHFHSSMTGAPVITGAAGALIAVLDACLVDGFGLKTADSVVVAGGVATATFSTGHSFEPDTIALIAGATPSGLNGEKRVLTTSTNAITFDATGIADTTATGTITAKLAPAGWQKAFSGTNLAAYRSLDATGTRHYLRVDDTGTTNARVVGYETMTDVNTGTGAFPLSSQVSGGGWWPKASAAGGSARAWTVVADGRTFYVHLHTLSAGSGQAGCVWGFGDFESYKSGDGFASFIQCGSNDEANSSGASARALEYIFPTISSGAPYVSRSFTALGGSTSAASTSEFMNSLQGASGAVGNPFTPVYPNGPNNGLVLCRKLVVEPSVCLRGHYRGALLAVQSLHTMFNWRDKVVGQGEFSGRKLLAVKCGAPNTSSSNGVMFFDITGPWS